MSRSNLAFESQHLLHALEANGIKRWCSLSEGQAGTLGFLTTNERKARRAEPNLWAARITAVCVNRSKCVCCCARR